MTPYITEERELRVSQMDVFSRLMIDRIIFMGAPVESNIANIVQAQLLFLQSVDPKKDIHMYINSPGGEVYAGLGIWILRFDLCQSLRSDGASYYGSNDATLVV
ncbi:ATP-dependent Clp protease proteolytic subunit [compost metagenome]